MQPTLPLPPNQPSAPATPPQGQMPQYVAPPVAPQPAPTPSDLQPAQQPQHSQATQQSTPVIADDGDLIEKEWVTKVKQIVTQTAHDPFEQNKRLTQLKAEYMYKRYGKTIKTDE